MIFKHSSSVVIGFQVFGQYLKELEFCVTVSVSRSKIFRPDRLASVRGGEGFDERKNMTLIRILDIVDSLGIGHDGHDFLLQRLGILEESDEVPIGFAHLASVDSQEGRNARLYVLARNLEDTSVDIISSLVSLIEGFRDIAGHLQVLSLILTDWNDVYVVGEDIGCHEDWVVEHSHIEIIFPFIHKI